jgi:hypothetical protein
MALAGLDLTTRLGAMAKIIPEEADLSPLVRLMETRRHPTVLTDEQLALVRTWIDQGAP